MERDIVVVGNNLTSLILAYEIINGDKADNHTEAQDLPIFWW